MIVVALWPFGILFRVTKTFIIGFAFQMVPYSWQRLSKAGGRNLASAFKTTLIYSLEKNLIGGQ